jgi:hypothetical protein
MKTTITTNEVTVNAGKNMYGQTCMHTAKKARKNSRWSLSLHSTFGESISASLSSSAKPEEVALFLQREFGQEYGENSPEDCERLGYRAE